jgi:ABC-2 type transport system permease protein
MTARSILGKLYAIVRRDLLTTARHRTGLGVQVIAVFVELAGFYFLARAIGPGFQPDGMSFYAFLLSGTALFGFFVTGVSSFVRAIEEAQMTGTMEVMMTTSTPPWLILLLSTFSIFSSRALSMVVFLAAGSLIFPITLQVDVAALIAVAALSIAIALAVGMFAASVQVAAQKGSAVVWLMGTMGWVLTGAMFPTSVLPRGLRELAEWLPFTHAIRGLRHAMLGAGTASQLQHSLFVLGAFALLLLPLSFVVFSYRIRRARLEGTLSFY